MARGKFSVKPYFSSCSCGYKTKCWIWQRSQSNSGYVKVTFGKSTLLGHRWMYELAHGNIEEGLVVDHLCRNKLCVRPDHLEAVSQSTNVRRGIGSKLTVEQVEEIRHASGKQRDIARQYGIQQSYVSNIKSGRR